MPKNKKKIYFPTLWCFIPKLDHNAGKGGGWYKERGKCNIKSRIEFPDPMFIILDTPHGPNAKFFLKKYWKMRVKSRENLFFTQFHFDSKTKSQFRSPCNKSERNLY